MTGHAKDCYALGDSTGRRSACNCGWNHYRAGLLRAAEMCRAQSDKDYEDNKGTVYGDPGNSHGLSDAEALADQIEAEANPKECEP